MRKTWQLCLVFVTVLAACGQPKAPPPSPSTATPDEVASPRIPQTAPATSTSLPRRTATPFPIAPLASTFGLGTVAEQVWTSDGSQIIVGGSLGLHVHDAQSLDVVQALPLVDFPSWGVSALSLSSNDASVWVGSLGRVQAYVLDTGKRIVNIELPVSDLVRQLAVTTDHSRLAVLTDEIASFSYYGSLSLFDGTTGSPVATLEAYSPVRIAQIAFSPDGVWLIGAREDRLIAVWDAQTGARVTELEGHTDRVTSLTFSPDGRSLVSGSLDGTLRTWAVGTWAPVSITRGLTGPVYHLQMVQGGQQLIARTAKGLEWRSWPALDLQRSLKDETIGNEFVSVSVSPKGDRLLSAHGIRNLTSDENVTLLNGYLDSYASLDVSADGQTLAMGTGSGVALWNQAQRAWSGATASTRYGQHAYLLPEGSRLLTVDFDQGHVVLWTVPDLTVLAAWDTGLPSVWRASVDAAGERLALMNADRIEVWDLTHQSRVTALPYANAMAGELGFSADDDTLLVDAPRGTVWAVDLMSGQRREVLNWDSQATDVPDASFFTPDGSLYVAWNNGLGVAHQAQIWDVARGQLRQVVDLHTIDLDTVHVAINPAGTLLAVGDSEGVKVLDLVDRARSMAIDGARMAVGQLAFSGDGRTLVALSTKGQGALWDISALADQAAAEIAAGVVQPTSVAVMSTPTVTSIPLALTPLPVSAAQNAISPETLASLVNTQVFGRGTLLSVALSPTGVLAIGGSRGVWLFRGDDWEQIAFFATSELVTRVCFARDGTEVDASGPSDERRWGWRLADHTDIAEPEACPAADLSPDGRVRLVVRNSSVIVENAASGAIRLSLGPFDGLVLPALAPDNQTVAIAGSGKVQLVDVNTGAERWSVQVGVFDEDTLGYDNDVIQLAFSPNGQTLAGMDWRGTVRLWSTLDGREQTSWSLPRASAGSLLWSRDGRELIVAQRSGLVEAWNIATASPLRRIDGFSSAQIRSVALDSTGALWTTDGGELYRWALASGVLRQVAEPITGTVTAIDPTGRHALIALGPVTFESRSVPDLTLEAVFTGTLQGASLRGQDVTNYSTFAFSPSGVEVLTAGTDPAARLWDVRTGQATQVLELDSFLSGVVAYSPDGRWVAVDNNDYTKDQILVFDTATGDRVRTLKPVEPQVSALAFTPDGLSLVSAGQRLQRWNLDQGTASVDLSIRASALAISPDGRLWVTGDRTGTLQFWEASTDRLLRTILAHTGEVSGMQFIEDGRRLLTWGLDGVVRLWDIQR